MENVIQLTKWGNMQCYYADSSTLTKISLSIYYAVYADGVLIYGHFTIICSWLERAWNEEIESVGSG